MKAYLEGYYDNIKIETKRTENRKVSVTMDFPPGYGPMIIDDDAKAKEDHEDSFNEGNGVDIGDVRNLEDESEGFVLLEDEEESVNEE
ncbi:hypothetical protein L1987_31071 [Smallanthus sonchifolius]|uniref:Uncharacterized protein n=1 Tax=Smallanthus sonchifolius TaxID=185202 RepID=A0ACB9I4J1_9ASTR|nr:hypothetical protein L1987_31071 [Smallanthus sonchifolius]